MANAKKCDRCGVFLNKETIPRMKAFMEPGTSTNHDIDVDLCYECYSDLEKFMSYRKNGEKVSNDHPVCTNRCKFKEVFGEEWLKGLDNVIKNTNSSGVADALSSFLTEEYKGACIDCEYFSDKEYYADNTVTVCAVSWGSCTKCQRNITSTSPHTEVPSWCPLKGDEDESNSNDN